ncbi:MAG TPA: type II toxin-antitoxin system prevent-host-death family antitoxin [Thermoanaerobaculia bacterium]|nr:type II toxin-antitoxin system prevent-host-death family antitoxin [Thermoanaerobaculia bacterium]
MTEVGVKALKDQLSSWLRRASAGERIVITEHGNPIAVLTPIEQSEDARDAWELVEAGLASWSGGKPRGSAHAVKPKGKSTAEMVLEDRR